MGETERAEKIKYHCEKEMRKKIITFSACASHELIACVLCWCCVCVYMCGEINKNTHERIDELWINEKEEQKRMRRMNGREEEWSGKLCCSFITFIISLLLLLSCAQSFFSVSRA
jgi:hypothetical protein